MSLPRGLLKLFVYLFCWWRIDNHGLFTICCQNPHPPPRSSLSHGVACLHWPLLSLTDMILTFQHLHICRDTFGLLYRVDLTTVVLTEDNHSHVVSSRLMARRIISVPQRFKVDFFACVGPALDGPILAVQETVSCIKGRKPCGCNQKCLLYSCKL